MPKNIGAETREVALVPTVSTAAGMVAAQLLPAKTGENVLVADIERISVPADAVFNIEHERGKNDEEIEFQLKWKLN